MTPILISLFVGISLGFLTWGMLSIKKDLNPSTLRRLEHIKFKMNESEKTFTAKDKFDIVIKDSGYQIQQLGSILKKFKITVKIKELLYLADSDMQIDTFIFISALCGLPFLIFLFTPYWYGAFLAILGCYIPTLGLKQTIDKRFNDFSKQFPDALNLMSSSLRAGHPLFSAIDIVTNEMPKPISKVFATTTKDLSLGADAKDAFLSMTKAMPQSIDLRFFVTAVLIQKEVGGNLALLLDKLSDTIRERFKLIAQLKVQTAQTRMSGTILGIVPIAIGGIVSVLNPEYIKPLFETPDGKIALIAAVCLTIGGGIAIKKVSSIEI